jgi:hypothetical protein
MLVMFPKESFAKVVVTVPEVAPGFAEVIVCSAPFGKYEYETEGSVLVCTFVSKPQGKRL